MDLTAKEFMEWKEATDVGDSFMTHSLAMVWLHGKLSGPRIMDQNLKS